MDNLMRSGEFAKVCHTTKETLRHYERIGLLLPLCVMDNGYKLYGSSQIVEYMVITSLKAAGCLLEEIREIIRSDNLDALKRIFLEKTEEITEKQAQLERSKLLLEGTIARLNEAKPWRGLSSDGQWYVNQLDCACYVETLIPLQAEQLSLIFESVADHEAYCRSNGVGYGTEWQKTYRLSGESFMSGNYDEKFFVCTRANKKTAIDRLFVRPAGFYLERVDWLPYDNMENAPDVLPRNPLAPTYESFRLYAKENGLLFLGDVFTAEIARESLAGKVYLSIKTSIALAD